MKLSQQAQIILNILSDRQWHCSIDWGYSDGHGKRYTDINRYLAPKGQKLAWEWCDCGRHTATIKKRKIVGLVKHVPTGMTAKQFLENFPTDKFPTKQKEIINTLF